MTKEELEKEAEEYADTKVDDRKGYNARWELVKQAYLAGAEPREKRIAELEAQIEKMSCKHNNCIHCGYKSECEIFKENAELKELLDCKNCCELDESECGSCAEFGHFRCKGKAQLTKAKVAL